MIVIDIETTGIDHAKSGIIQIGALVYERPSQTFLVDLKPHEGAEINKYALEVNGTKEEDLKDPKRLSEKDALERLLKFVGPGRHILMNFNAEFEVKFLREAFNRHSLKYPFGFRIIDLHSVASFMALKRGKAIGNFSSKEVSNFLGIPEEVKPHNALAGAKWAYTGFQAAFRRL